MIRGIYSAGSGMRVNALNQEVISNNLANTVTTGFKRSGMAFKSFGSMLIERVESLKGSELSRRRIGEMGIGSASSGTYTDFSQGPVNLTENKLDLAIEGRGFFVVESDRGEYLTRNGALRLDREKRLVTGEGFPVLGEEGYIYINGTDIEIGSDGSIMVDGNPAGRIRVVEPDPAAGEPVNIGGSLFDAGGGRLVDSDSRVLQGYLEGSNVNIIKEMVDMILCMRIYEAGQRVISAQDATLDKAVNEVGRLK